MDTKTRLCPGLVITLVGILILSTSCNFPGLAKNQNLASQSQALSGGGNQGAGLPPGYGSNRLQYNHNFSWDYKGTASLHLDLTVKGVVPLADTQIGEGPAQCVVGTFEPWYLQVSGNGTIPIQGSASTSDSSNSCSCSFTNSLQVSILGKTTYEWLTPGDKCQVNVIYLKLTEKWYTAPDWQCTCTKPEEAISTERIMDSFGNFANPELEKKTLAFQAGCAGDSILEADLADPTHIGVGKYRWTYTSSVNEPSNQGYRVQQPGMASTEWAGGTPVVRINSCVAGWWGPSLESIVQPVTQWNPASP
ncbi:MAG: hypothetical protein ABSB61_00720 [Anaerolineales bacterium]|jgi:hypothetical protein